MSWSAVQTWQGAASGPSISLSGTATTAGNTLVLGVVSYTSGSFTAPSGWSTAASAFGVTPSYALYYLANASSITSVSLTGSGGNWSAVLGELSGGGTTITLDGTTAAGSGGATGTITTSNSGDAVVGFVAGTNGNDVWSSPTNSFTLWQQGRTGSPSAGAALAFVYLLGASAGSHSSSLTLSAGSGTQVGALAGLSGSTSPLGTLAATASPAALSLSITESAPASATLAASSAGFGSAVLNQFPLTGGISAGAATATLTATQSAPAVAALATTTATASLHSTQSNTFTGGLVTSAAIFSGSVATLLPVTGGLYANPAVLSAAGATYKGLIGSISASTATASLGASWTVPGGLQLVADTATASLTGTETVKAASGLIATTATASLGVGQSPWANFALAATTATTGITGTVTTGGVGFELVADTATASLGTAPTAFGTFGMAVDTATAALSSTVAVGSLALQADTATTAAQVTVKGLSTFALAAAPATANLMGASVTGISGTWVYHIYANNGAGGPLNLTTPVATVAGTTWTTTVAKPSDTTWLVRTFDLATGLEDQNADARVTVVIGSTGTDLTALPNAPSGLTVVPTAGGGALATWVYSPGGQGGAPQGFHVYTGTPAVSYATPVTTVAYGGPYTGAGIAYHYQARFTGLTDGTIYQVGVRTYNATGEESNTITAAVTGAASGPQPIPSLTATLGT